MTTSPARFLALLLCLALSAPAALAEDTPTAPAKTPDAADPAAAGPKAGETEAKKADPTIPVIKVLSNGAEPRVELRYRPTANTTANYKTETLVDIDSPMFKATIGPIKATLQVKYAKTADGRTPLDVEITHSEMVDDGSNPMISRMKPAIDGLKGSKLSGSSSDCGVFKGAEAAGEPNATRSTMAGRMPMLMPPLPKEALGVGASWSVTAEISVNNVKQTSVVTSTIEKIEGDRVVIALKLTRKARDVTMVAMGQEMPVKSVDGEGTGKLTLDLHMGGVTQSESKITTKTVMDMMGNEMLTTAIEKSSVKGAPATATTVSVKPAAEKPETAKPEAAK